MKKRTRAVALVCAVVLSVAPRVAAACAGCRNPSLPLLRPSAVALAANEVRVTVAATATTVHVVHEAGCRDLANCGEVPLQPLYLHDQVMYPTELRAIGEWGLTPALGLELHLPVRAVRTSITYSTPEGAPYQPLDAGVHHRDETVAGLADAWVMARASVAIAGWSFTARGGVTVPLGGTEENPFVRGDQGLPHQHIQLGNGTFDPLLVLDAARFFGRVNVSGYASMQLPFYENAKGFRAGGRLGAGAQAGGLTLQQISALLGLDVLGEQPERWDGAIRQDGNLGRTEVLAGLSLLRPFGATTISATVRVPIYRQIIAGAESAARHLSSPVIVTLSVGRVFSR